MTWKFGEAPEEKAWDAAMKWKEDQEKEYDPVNLNEQSILQMRREIKQAAERRKVERTAHVLLHQLWTKAVGTKAYNKRQWMEMESLLAKKESAGSCGPETGRGSREPFETRR